MTPEEQAARQRRVSELRWQYDAAVAAYVKVRATIEEIKCELEMMGELP